MRRDDYKRRLAEFKAQEKPEAVLFVGDDPDLARIVLAWTNTTIRVLPEITPLNSELENEVWEWLWENSCYSIDELIQKSGQSRYRFSQKVSPLIDNRVLYPDGTINSFVQRFLREKVLRLFDARPKRTRKSTG